MFMYRMTKSVMMMPVLPNLSYRFNMCVSVDKSCPTLCNPLDCSVSGFSFHGTFQARILEWMAISFSKEFSLHRDQIHNSCISYIGR